MRDYESTDLKGAAHFAAVTGAVNPRDLGFDPADFDLPATGDAEFDDLVSREESGAYDDLLEVV